MERGELTVSRAPVSSPAAAPARRLLVSPLLRRGRWLGPVALAAAGATLIYLLRPGAVTDDTYAFMDWGRDLRHGFTPLLEHRTFQPLPIGVGAVVSFFGSAAPTIVVLVCLAALVLLAEAAWRIVAMLGFRQPAPLLAAVLALATPLLPVLALSAYNNLPFATFVLLALMFELERRRRAAWTALILASLTRPEGWAFLLAYGALAWWRAGRPLAPRGVAPVAIAALAPMALWIALEWGLFGDPLYSLRNTTAAQSTHTNSPEELWYTLRANVPTAVLVASAVGIVAIARFAPRRLAATTLAAVALTAVTILVLATSSFNVPGRHFSVLVALVCVLAAAGATAPASWLRARGSATWAGIGAGLAAAALLLGLAAPRMLDSLKSNLANIAVSHDTGRTLSDTANAALKSIDVRGAPRHSVAMLGAVAGSELVWALGVPYNAVSDHVESHTRLIVQPSPRTFSRLKNHDLTDRIRTGLPHGWRVIASGAWEIYASPGPARARLR
jgi:hypothetical protein